MGNGVGVGRGRGREKRSGMRKGRGRKGRGRKGRGEEIEEQGNEENGEEKGKRGKGRGKYMNDHADSVTLAMIRRVVTIIIDISNSRISCSNSVSTYL